MVSNSQRLTLFPRRTYLRIEQQMPRVRAFDMTLILAMAHKAPGSF